MSWFESLSQWHAVSMRLWHVEVIGFVVGIIVTLVLSRWFVSWLLDRIEKKTFERQDGVIPRPSMIDAATWEESWRRYGTVGRYMGAFETTIFFTSFWFDGWPLLASWLAFKVASQWESWKYGGVIRKYVEDRNPRFEDLLAVQHWVGLRYSRFLVGTAANIVIALIGTAVGRLLVKVIW